MSNIDQRNIGGRSIIQNNMFNHQKALIEVKSHLKTQTRPQSGPSKQQKPKYKRLEEFNEVFDAFKRVASVTSGNLTAQPKTFGLRRATPNQNKQNNNKTIKKAKQQLGVKDKYENWIHQNNLKSTGEKISQYGSLMHERKKNTQDPIAHPVMFMRTYNKENNRDIKVDSLFGKYNIGQPKSIANFPSKTLSCKTKQLMKQTTPQQLFGSSSYELAMKRLQLKETGKVNRLDKNGLQCQKDNIKNDDEEGHFLIDVPQVQENTPEAYQVIKKKLIQQIINHRIFRNDDLQSLFGRTLLYNQHLDVNQLEDIFAYIHAELDA